MKKLLLIGLVLMLGFSGHAQDLLVKRNGQRIYAVVMDISKKKVVYQRWGYPYSPLESVKTKALWGIRFENGQMVRFDHLWKDDDDDHYKHHHHHYHDGYYDDDDDRYEHHHKKHHHYHDGYYYYRDDDDDDDDREEMIEDFLEDMREYANPVKKAKKAMEDWEDWLEDRMEDDDD